MSAETAINLAFAGFLGLFAFVMWRFCRDPKPKAKARDVIAAVREIDELELLYSLPAYDEAAAAIDEGLTHLFEELGPPLSPDPMDTGRDRLWDAIHDDQNKGEA